MSILTVLGGLAISLVVAPVFALYLVTSYKIVNKVLEDVFKE